MDPTQIEINKTKLNIVNLSNKLINTFNPSEEISINYELKKEVDFLLTLLTKKMNSPMNQIPMNNNNMNLFNPMMNNNIDINLVQQQMQMMQQMQIIQQQQMLQQQAENAFIMLEFHEIYKKKIRILCQMNDKIRDVIQKYRSLTLTSDKNDKFIYNGKALYPDSDLTVAECGLYNNSIIQVLSAKNVRGG